MTNKNKEKEMKKYCPICGNPLNPKIHIMKFGKTKKEIKKIQSELLKILLMNFYLYSPKMEDKIDLLSITEILGTK